MNRAETIRLILLWSSWAFFIGYVAGKHGWLS
jgi:hypothetical protein